MIEKFKSLVQSGIDKKLISFSEDKKKITYYHQRKTKNYTPEEKVQAEAYLKLILEYGYEPEQIKLFVPVVIGSGTKEADIIVYNQNGSARIVVECKKEEATELELKQATEQAFSYAATGTIRAKYFWVTSKIKDSYFEIPVEEPKNYRPIPDIPSKGASGLLSYKYAKGGGTEKNQKLFDLEIVTQGELTKIFKQAHNSLWGGGELDPSAAFDELDKLIFCKIWDERKPRTKGEHYDFQIFAEKENKKKLKERIDKLYEEGREQDSEIFKEDILLSAEKLYTVVGYLQNINLSKTDLDSKGRAFETFMGSFFRGDFGQFFTPRNIVNFIVDALPITNDSRVLDTSCGSGGFLLHALDKIRKEADKFYPTEIKTEDKAEGAAHHRHWHDFAEKNLFGIEINKQIARTAKMNMLIHDDGHTNVVTADGLLLSEELEKKTGNKGFKYNNFDFIITNPPFGSKIKQTEQSYMKHYGFALKEVDWLEPNSKISKRNTQSTEILFIEQCHQYLKEGGYLAIVIPDGILTNSSLQYVRDKLIVDFCIVAVISMPQIAFQSTGAGVKSSVLFLKKHQKKESANIQRQIIDIENDLKEKYDYESKFFAIKKKKIKHIKELRGFQMPAYLENKELKEIKKSTECKEWEELVNKQYKEKTEQLKELLQEKYEVKKKEELENYPIFMAIAENIGYDATGRKTGLNELDIIRKELGRFITTIENGKV